MIQAITNIRTESDDSGFTDSFRLDVNRRISKRIRSQHGQFMTPSPLARLMADMFRIESESLHLLDPGAGVGALLAAFVQKATTSQTPLRKLHITAYEIDPALVEYLQETFRFCASRCETAGIAFSYELIQEDFIERGVREVRAISAQSELFSQASSVPRYDCVIMNPPYKKINSQSRTRKLLSSAGMETTNMYTAFLWLAFRLMQPEGQLVAITPRSFCNGPYFRPFRAAFGHNMKFNRIHIFNSRNAVFGDDEVLQENIIFNASRTVAQNTSVTITSSDSVDVTSQTLRQVPHVQVLNPVDPQLFINIIPDTLTEGIALRMARFTHTLASLNIQVSTGRVVDYRAQPHLRQQPEDGAVPLVYPVHFLKGFVHWPNLVSKKPNALALNAETRDLLVPNAFYVLCKRFTAKEETRRLVAAVFDPADFAANQIGFENHVNYFHENGAGLSENLAKGLAVYLNSTLLDLSFRQFSGHTQVNATDLRSLQYPSRDELESLGAQISKHELPSQDIIDQMIEERLFNMAKKGGNPVQGTKKIEDALQILTDLDFPRAQLNDRSALTLLALLDMKPESTWRKAKAPLIGITQLMNFFSEHYGRTYAPNSRETVRRFTMHQFVQAGIAIPNPDEPRPTNSPNFVYQIEPAALKLIRSYGTKGWTGKIKSHLALRQGLASQYQRERDMQRIPVKFADKKITLSAGGQNPLIKAIIEEFCQRFTPGGEVLYIGDADKKWAYYDKDTLQSLGVQIGDEHGKMPDLVVYYRAKKWLILVEAVTSHGPVNPKRRVELEELFDGSQPGLVFVTAFMDRKTMIRYINDISWESEVWVAEAPSHMIHFNGERFLGPY